LRGWICKQTLTARMGKRPEKRWQQPSADKDYHWSRKSGVVKQTPHECNSVRNVRGVCCDLTAEAGQTQLTGYRRGGVLARRDSLEADIVPNRAWNISGQEGLAECLGAADNE